MTLAEQGQAIAVARRQINVVQHRDDREPLLTIQPFQQLQKLKLVMQIEKGGGFVQQQHFGVLSQGQRQKKPAAVRRPTVRSRGDRDNGQSPSSAALAPPVRDRRHPAPTATRADGAIAPGSPVGTTVNPSGTVCCWGSRANFCAATVGERW